MMNNRWWTYQRERFPLLAHAPLILAFCLSVMLFSALQQGEFKMPALLRISGAFVSTLILFFQLRVADEFKDRDIDRKYRPHRPVPRGLVGLRELATIAYCGAAVQFAIALYIDVGLVPLLVAVWIYLGLMTREFFAADWLRRTPIAYLLSHMLIMPMIAFYVSAFDWLCDCRGVPGGLGWLLALSFFCGLILELGRKIRLPEHEQRGVETYSALWGTRKSLGFWVVSVAAAIAAYANAAPYISAANIFLPLAFLVLVMATVTAISFPRDGAGRHREFSGKLIEPGSGLVALMLYVGLGPLQVLLGQ